MWWRNFLISWFAPCTGGWHFLPQKCDEDTNWAGLNTEDDHGYSIELCHEHAGHDHHGSVSCLPLRCRRQARLSTHNFWNISNITLFYMTFSGYGTSFIQGQDIFFNYRDILPSNLCENSRRFILVKTSPGSRQFEGWGRKRALVQCIPVHFRNDSVVVCISEGH